MLPQTIPSRKQIEALQEAMIPLACEQPEPNHFFAPGMYLRELTVPKDMLIVGKIHRHAHFLAVLKGRALILSEHGNTEVTAGHISISQPNTKRVVLALEDTQFITVHHNPEDIEDLEIIEAQHMIPESLSVENRETLKVQS